LAENFVDYQPRTSAEVRRRLTRADFGEDIVERVVSELESAGLIDDARFSEQWVESRARGKKLGAARLAAELRTKGISKEQTESALEQLDPESELQNALALARKRLGLTDDGRRMTDSDDRPPTTGDGSHESRSTQHSPGSVIRHPSSVNPDPDTKRRLAAYLQRRGYNWEIVQQVFAELFQNSD